MVGRAFGYKGLTPYSFNPFGKQIFKQEAKRKCKAYSAKVLLALHDQRRVPSWALQHVDMEFIKAAAE
jgi:hypothetical protein